MRTLLRLAVWTLLAALMFVTLAPIGLRPEVGPANLERVLAYGGFGLLATLAYPRQRLAVLLAVVAAAALLEYGQVLTATRHGRPTDFLVKAGGGAAGWLAAQAVLLVTERGASGDRR
ncbi:hypothetical protein Q8W71_24610 [Methylobacterium sp. NEAU 140]|uniref:hypothetical protein n=1 Tax=Methylobacterium sp. NEAU 140 TaxID=3064945 RepID=UPI002732AB04|nr:hypothetical protein [Methylobacterium sp. NEAU 140]MDP4025817.1 hypothetical protein [Methylobacterium sp. NEAU 140]